jgi:hypothetical protein
MKFEKFLKGVGTHGEVVEVREGEKWLVCQGVGMMIPKGVDNLLGSNARDDEDGLADMVKLITLVELDDPLTLEEAILIDPAGGAKDIYRVFETALGDRVGITNGDYGLLERKDALSYFEVETDDGIIIKYVVVYDPHMLEVIGYITGSQIF